MKVLQVRRQRFGFLKAEKYEAVIKCNDGKKRTVHFSDMSTYDWSESQYLMLFRWRIEEMIKKEKTSKSKKDGFKAVQPLLVGLEFP